MGFLPTQCKVIQFDPLTVTLDIEGQTVVFPRTAIAGNLVVGDIVQLVAIAPGKQQDADQEVARAMLNRLLGEGATNA